MDSQDEPTDRIEDFIDDLDDMADYLPEIELCPCGHEGRRHQGYVPLGRFAVDICRDCDTCVRVWGQDGEESWCRPEATGLTELLELLNRLSRP